MSEPTCWALCYSGAGCLSGVGTYLPGTVLQWCYCFSNVRTYLPHCVTVMQTVLAMSKPTCRALCYSGADCLSNVRTYLQGTVLQWFMLFKRGQHLPTGHCVTVVQTVKAVSELTYRALCYSGADCFSNVRTYLPGTVLQGCRLYKRCQNLPTGHCVTVVQTVLAMSVPTYPALCYRGAGCISSVRTYLLALCYSGADCFSNVRTYLPDTVLQ